MSKKRKIRKYTKHKKKRISKIKYFRYSAFKLWTVTGDEEYFPQLELKAFIFSNKPLNKQITKIKLNDMINTTKEGYDFNNFFEVQAIRRRIAYETERISELEFNERNTTIITVNDDEHTIRDGFPKTRFF